MFLLVDILYLCLRLVKMAPAHRLVAIKMADNNLTSCSSNFYRQISLLLLIYFLQSRDIPLAYPVHLQRH